MSSLVQKIRVFGLRVLLQHILWLVIFVPILVSLVASSGLSSKDAGFFTAAFSLWLMALIGAQFTRSHNAAAPLGALWRAIPAIIACWLVLIAISSASLRMILWLPPALLLGASMASFLRAIRLPQPAIVLLIGLLWGSCCTTFLWSNGFLYEFPSESWPNQLMLQLNPVLSIAYQIFEIRLLQAKYFYENAPLLTDVDLRYLSKLPDIWLASLLLVILNALYRITWSQIIAMRRGLKGERKRANTLELDGLTT